MRRAAISTGSLKLIVSLARSGDMRQELAERAVARAEELVWERSEVELLGAYERL